MLWHGTLGTTTGSVLTWGIWWGQDSQPSLEGSAAPRGSAIPAESGFSGQDDHGRLSGNGFRVAGSAVRPRTCEAESPREPGHQLYVSYSISSTLKMPVSLRFSNAIPVLVLEQVLHFPLWLSNLSPSLGH